MKPVKAITRIIVGLIFGIISWLVLSPAVAAIDPNADSSTTSVASFLLIVGISVALGFFAPTIRRAFGRGFLLSGVCLLALPLSTFLLSGRAMNDVIAGAEASDQAFAAAGAGIAGMALTGVATFIGLIGGAIFIIIGLVLALGGNRQVVIIKEGEGR